MTMHSTRNRYFFVALTALAAALALSAGTNAQPQPSNEEAWQQFMQWLPGAPPVDGPKILFDQYRSRLTSGGASAAEADRQMDVIRRLMRERPDAWRVMFNNIYSSSTPGFSTQPNALLISAVESRKPGRALDIGMGQGRNSVFLALKGWQVTGFDMSEQGIAVARKNAERAGVKLDAIVATDDAFDYGADRWDLIVFMYEPFPITTASYVERVRKSMKTGGVIVVESFGEDETVVNRPTTAIDPGRLLSAFKDFRLLHFEVAAAVADWGPKTKRPIVRMVAEKRP